MAARSAAEPGARWSGQFLASPFSRSPAQPGAVEPSPVEPGVRWSPQCRAGAQPGGARSPVEGGGARLTAGWAESQCLKYRFSSQTFQHGEVEIGAWRRVVEPGARPSPELRWMEQPVDGAP